MDESGTSDLMICVPGLASMPSMRPRREFKSPITSPMYSSGRTTSTFITGSSSTGWALRLADISADIEFAHHAVHDDFQMEFAHSGDDRLCGVRIGVNPECRIFLRELVERDTHFFLIGFGFRLDCNRDDGLGEGHRFKN